MNIAKLNEIIKELAPDEYNSIIIDNAVALKRFDYYYIKASVQRVEFRSDSVSCAVDRYLAQEIMLLKGRNVGKPYVEIDKGMLERVKKAPRVSGEGFFSGAKRKVGELINGGRTVDMNLLELATADGRLSQEQPSFAVKEECGVTHCRRCKGTGKEEHVDKQGIVTNDQCPVCEGFGYVGSVTWFSPSVTGREISLLRCLPDVIDNLKPSVLEAHKGDDSSLVRMSTHFNGVNEDSYPEQLKPYLDMLHDKVGEENAVEDIYFRIIPCYTFQYRNVLTGGIRTGVLVDPDNPEIFLTLDGTGRKLFSGVSNSVKSINNFFGSITRTGGFKDKEDLRRTVRLLIAVVVADGTVNEEEKKALTLTIRDIHDLTTGEQDELVKLLGSADSSFLTDDDFNFHKRENREETLARMEEIAGSDGLVHETEREIIERLRFKY